MGFGDRPYPVDYEYRGVKSRISFQWGNDGDPIPKGLRVEVDHPETPVLASREKAKYDSFEDAIASGNKMAELEIDRILGPVTES
jgi:hypothetical protein